MDILVDFEPKYPGYVFFLSLLLQCKFANSTLLSLLRFSYFITPYDAQASSALIKSHIAFKAVIAESLRKTIFLKNLLQNQWADCNETWYVALGIRAY